MFDGEKEAKLIALAHVQATKGRARWSLRLLESKVVELNIVGSCQRQHDRPGFKKTFSAPSRQQGSSRRKPKPARRSRDEKDGCSRHRHTIQTARCLAWTRTQSKLLASSACHPICETGAPGTLRLRVRAKRHPNLLLMFDR